MFAQMVALSTRCVARAVTPAAFLARAAECGAGGVALDPSVEPGWVAELEPALYLARDSLPLVAVAAPAHASTARRTPMLASLDDDERRAAAQLVTLAIDRAERHGAGVVVLSLGELPLRHGHEDLARRYARATLTAEFVSRIEEERVRLSPRALDAARFGLDLVLPAAARGRVVLALQNRARWTAIPDDVELGVLLEDYRGAPLSTWVAPDAAYVRDRLGFTGREARTALLIRAAGAWLSDAAGLEGELPWGSGEVNHAALLAALPEHALRVIHTRADTTDAELAVALLAA